MEKNLTAFNVDVNLHDHNLLGDAIDGLLNTIYTARCTCLRQGEPTIHPYLQTLTTRSLGVTYVCVFLQK
jgi:hypothetical protein